MTLLRTFRFRLAAWYFASVMLLLGVLGAGSWYAMKSSIYRAIDTGLVNRMRGVIGVLNQYAGLNRTDLSRRLDESSNLMVGGSLFRVFDSHNQLIYQSPGLDRHHVAAGPPPIAGSEIVFRNIDRAVWSLRTASQRLTVNGEPEIVEIAEPLRSYEGALARYQMVVLMSLPLLIIFAACAGSYISGRALAPVDRITTGVREISASNLSDRLPVPDTADELQRLSETLNGMLDRIESSFNRNRQFTADASHELRAPMTLIHSAAEFALRRERSREELQNALRQILRESKRTSQLMNRLLSLARADANVRPAMHGLVNLTAILQDIRLQAQNLAEGNDQQLAFFIPETPVEVIGDDLSLHQLCFILIDNALKYTPSHGSISVSLHEGEGPDLGAAVLTVRDTGIGISPDQLPHVFDRFWRADKIRSRETGGAGLGLSIARQVAEQHGASISVESEPGAGTAFTVTLALAEKRMPLSA